MNSNANSGIGFVGLLTILFIALKLTGHIDWSWIWILAPIWISAGLGIFVILCLIAVAVIAASFESKRERTTEERLRAIHERLVKRAGKS